MQAIGSLAAGARAAVTGALHTLGHLTGAHDGQPVAVPGVPETGYVGANVICAAAGKRMEDYLTRRTTKARAQERLARRHIARRIARAAGASARARWRAPAARERAWYIAPALRGAVRRRAAVRARSLAP
jgi:hypothetical protein